MANSLRQPKRPPFQYRPGTGFSRNSCPKRPKRVFWDSKPIGVPEEKLQLCPSSDKVLTDPDEVAAACHNGRRDVPYHIVRRWPEKQDGLGCVAVYEGTMQNGRAEGLGMHVMDNGDLLFGEFKRNKCTGMGFYVFCDHDLIYVGDYQDGVRHGYGIEYYEERGALFQGMHRRDVEFGPGVMTYADGQQDAGFWNGQVLEQLEFCVSHHVLYSDTPVTIGRECTGCVLEEKERHTIAHATRLIDDFEPTDPVVRKAFAVVKRFFVELREAVTLCEAHTCDRARVWSPQDPTLRQFGRFKNSWNEDGEDKTRDPPLPLYENLNLQGGDPAPMCNFLPFDLGYAKNRSTDDRKYPGRGFGLSCMVVVHAEKLLYFRAALKHIIICGEVVDHLRSTPPGPLIVASVDYMLCAWEGFHTRQQKWLLSRLVRPDVADRHRATSAFLAAVRGNYECINTILAYGGSVNHVTLGDMTAYSAAFHVRYCYRGILCTTTPSTLKMFNTEKRSSRAAYPWSGHRTWTPAPKAPVEQSSTWHDHAGSLEIDTASESSADEERSPRNIVPPEIRALNKLEIASVPKKNLKFHSRKEREFEQFCENSYRQIVLDNFPLAGGLPMSEATRRRQQGEVLCYVPPKRGAKPWVPPCCRKPPKLPPVPVKEPPEKKRQYSWIRERMIKINEGYRPKSPPPPETQLEKMDKTLAVLLAAGADVIKHTQPEPLIFCAIKASSHDAFQLLRSKGADIHYKLGWKEGSITALHHAAYHGNEKSAIFLRKLLSLGLDPNCAASRSVITSRVEETEEDVHWEGWRARSIPEDYVRPEVLQSFDIGVIKERNSNRGPLQTALLAVMVGWTPLHMVSAQVKNHKFAVQMAEDLLHSGAKVNLLTESGHSPLSLAIHSCNYRLVDILLAAGADATLRLGVGIYNAFCVLLTLKSISVRTTEQSLSLARTLLERGVSVLDEVDITARIRGTLVEYSMFHCKKFGTFVGKSYDQMSKDELHQFETSAKLRQLILKKRRYEARFAERKRLVKMIERTLEEQSLTESVDEDLSSSDSEEVFQSESEEDIDCSLQERRSVPGVVHLTLPGASTTAGPRTAAKAPTINSKDIPRRPFARKPSFYIKKSRREAAEELRQAWTEEIDRDSFFSQCYNCGRKYNITLTACIRCLYVKYCSTECKSESWATRHHRECFSARVVQRELNSERRKQAFAADKRSGRPPGEKKVIFETTALDEVRGPSPPVAKPATKYRLRDLYILRDYLRHMRDEMSLWKDRYMHVQ